MNVYDDIIAASTKLLSFEKMRETCPGGSLVGFGGSVQRTFSWTWSGWWWSSGHCRRRHDKELLMIHILTIPWLSCLCTGFNVAMWLLWDYKRLEMEMIWSKDVRRMWAYTIFQVLLPKRSWICCAACSFSELALYREEADSWLTQTLCWSC